MGHNHSKPDKQGSARARTSSSTPKKKPASKKNDEQGNVDDKSIASANIAQNAVMHESFQDRHAKASDFSASIPMPKRLEPHQTNESDSTGSGIESAFRANNLDVLPLPSRGSKIASKSIIRRQKEPVAVMKCGETETIQFLQHPKAADIDVSMQAKTTVVNKIYKRCAVDEEVHHISEGYD